MSLSIDQMADKARADAQQRINRSAAQQTRRMLEDWARQDARDHATRPTLPTLPTTAQPATRHQATGNMHITLEGPEPDDMLALHPIERLVFWGSVAIAFASFTTLVVLLARQGGAA